MQSMVLDYIKDQKIISIVRGFKTEDAVRLAEALYQGGIRLIEITFEQGLPEHQTVQSIEKICALGHRDLLVGAGTVMTREQASLAREGGAAYLISPDTNPEVIEYAKAHGLISMPGAMTPSEVAYAHALGADIVKLFPCSVLGPAYIKAIRAPLRHIPLAAVGGITLDNMAEYFRAGVCCVGIGSNLASHQLVKSGSFNEVTQLATTYVAKIRHEQSRGTQPPTS